MSTNESFKMFAEVNKPRIDKHLKAVLRLHQIQAKTMNVTYYDVVKELNVLVARGGKRMRPLLFLLAYRGYGGRRTSCALELAVSQELLHTFLLIHDDVIDRDFMRWGGPNISAVYFEKYSQHMDAREALHMADSIAVLAGNACMTLAYDRVTASGMDNHVMLDLIRKMEQAVFAVTAGELADVAGVHLKKTPTESEILAMYSAKTASYSFALPLQMGAIAAAAPEPELELLAGIANSLGIAFQLHDDILGVFGDEKTIGKPVMSDIREGKRTLLVVRALAEASSSTVRQSTRSP